MKIVISSILNVATTIIIIVVSMIVSTCCFTQAQQPGSDNSNTNSTNIVPTTPPSLSPPQSPSAPSPSPSLPLLSGRDAQITLKKGDAVLLDFFQLIPKSYGGMVVQITAAPRRGRLFALPKDISSKTNALPSKTSLIGSSPRRRKGQLLATFTVPVVADGTALAAATSYKSLFVYVAANNETNPLVFDAYEETFKYSVFNGNDMADSFDGTAYVRVLNAIPYVPLNPVTKYVRTTVGSDTNAKQLTSRDFSEKALKQLASTSIPLNDDDMILCGSNEIDSVTIVDPAGAMKGNACTVRTVNGDRELADGVVLQNTDLRVYATFTSDAGDAEKKLCEFKYRVKDSSGAVSRNAGTLRFQQKTTSNKPQVYDREYRYYPSQQRYVFISLSSFGDARTAVKRRNIVAGSNQKVGVRPAIVDLPTASDDDGSLLGQRTFFITRYPSIGNLYFVPKSSDFSTNTKFLQDHLIAPPKSTAKPSQSSSTSGGSDNNNNNNNTRIKIVAGNQRRITLLYVLDTSLVASPAELAKIINTNETFTWQVRSADGIFSDEARVTITFRDNNRNEPGGAPVPGQNPDATFAPKSLKCGSMIYDWVFWNRIVHKVRLNYTLPKGDRIDRIMLLSNMGVPELFGSLYKQSSKIYGARKEDQTTDAVRAGDIVILSDNRWPKFRFVPNASDAKRLVDTSTASVVEQVYTFKLTTRMGSQCIATINFRLKKHDQNVIVKDPVTGVTQTQATIFDAAPYGTYTLFALRGKYSTNPDYQYVKIVSSPNRGVLFSINTDKLPYDEGMTSQETLDPTADSYCTRHNCEKYLVQPRLRRNSVVARGQLMSRDSLSVSSDRFWVMYQAPWKRSFKSEGDAMNYDESDNNNANSRARDSFSIQFCKTQKADSGIGGGDCAPEVIFYQLNLFEGSLRRIYVPFVKNSQVQTSSSSPANITTFDDMTVVPITLGKSSETLVRILDFDQIRRHGLKPEFRLYQAKRSGADSFNFGPALGLSTSEEGISGSLVKTENSDENTILLVPNAGTRYQNFRFRARLYNRTLLKKIDKIQASDDGKLQMLSVFEDVRVIAVRQNSPPKWNATNEDRDFGDVPLGKSVSWSFQVIDKDNDQITFIVKKAPIHADLFIFYSVFGKGQNVRAYDGLRFTAPRGATDFRSWLVVEYRPRFEPSLGKSYPVNDSFALIADDGSGILSETLKVAARIVPPVEGWNGVFSPEYQDKLKPNTSATSSKTLLHFAIAFAIVVIGGFIIWFLRRRKLLREQFAKLANFDAEGSGGATEMN